MTVREEIERLKKEKDAVILAHYYVRPEVQELADYIGDSFYLSRMAAGLKERTIVFCGVSFMGESAKALSPDKTVLMPDAHSDCAMAHMADTEKIRRVREAYDDVAVVCYINSTAELKRCSDVVVDYLKDIQPEKTYHVMSQRLICPDMKKTGLEEVLHVVRTEENEVVMDGKICEESRKPLEEMLRLATQSLI